MKAQSKNELQRLVAEGHDSQITKEVIVASLRHQGIRDFTQPQFHAEISRRRFLDLLGLSVAVGVFTPGDVFAPPLIQDNWRNCNKCRTLFFNGYRRGRCPAGGAHAGDDRNYRMAHDSPGPGQPDWRFCNKCDVMFYNAYPEKGACSAGGGHVAQGFNFKLRYDNRADGEHEWRFCSKCRVIFHNLGGTKQGVCAAGGGHVAAGNSYRYILDDSVRID